ncbi:MAG: hypothetical protein R3F20_04730 [Planctomycetota bacterium]
MTLFQSILLFLPLCFVICFFSTAMRKRDLGEVTRGSLRLFAYMTLTIVAVCLVLHLAMEWLLAD